MVFLDALTSLDFKLDTSDTSDTRNTSDTSNTRISCNTHTTRNTCNTRKRIIQVIREVHAMHYASIPIEKLH